MPEHFAANNANLGYDNCTHETRTYAHTIAQQDMPTNANNTQQCNNRSTTQTCNSEQRNAGAQHGQRHTTPQATHGHCTPQRDATTRFSTSDHAPVAHDTEHGPAYPAGAEQTPPPEAQPDGHAAAKSISQPPLGTAGAAEARPQAQRTPHACEKAALPATPTRLKSATATHGPAYDAGAVQEPEPLANQPSGHNSPKSCAQPPWQENPARHDAAALALSNGGKPRKFNSTHGPAYPTGGEQLPPSPRSTQPSGQGSL